MTILTYCARAAGAWQVSELREQIKSKLGVPADKVGVLSVGGSKLYDFNVLRDCGIEAGTPVAGLTPETAACGAGARRATARWRAALQRVARGRHRDRDQQGACLSSSQADLLCGGPLYGHDGAHEERPQPIQERDTGPSSRRPTAPPSLLAHTMRAPRSMPSLRKNTVDSAPV